jgi:hypothetical protein
MIILAIIVNYSHVSLCLRLSGDNKPNQMKETPEDTKAVQKNVANQFKKYQVGLLAKLPDGPLTENDAKKALKEDQEQKNGDDKNKSIGVVYIAQNLRNKRMGKFRIKPDGIKLFFPTDKDRINYQDIKDNENFQHFVDINRVEFEKNKLKEAEVDFKKNPYKDIYDEEKKMIDKGLLKVNNNKYKKHLMNMVLEKEQEIYNKMVNNDYSEVKVRKYNKQFYNPAYRANKNIY